MQGNIDINIPKFRSELEKNPRDFVEEIERYFRFKNVSNDVRKLIILNGRARIWMNFKRETIVTFEQFKLEFLNEFYSVPIKVKLENRWHSRKYSYQDGRL